MVSLFSTLIGIAKGIATLLGTIALLALFVIQLQLRDLYYGVSNLVRRKRPIGKVIPAGRPGYGGVWPPFVPPALGSDSRSPCPALNALANHDILPHNGKQLTYKQMSDALQHAYNLAPSLADQLTASARLLDQGRGWIDLQDLNALNVIQHDASFTRPDSAFCPDQSSPHPGLVDRFLAHASNGQSLSLDDIVYFSGLRRSECKRTNGQYSLTWSFLHKFFGSGNCALMYAVFGGDVESLRTWLAEERIPDGWEPKNREAFGHTITVYPTPSPLLWVTGFVPGLTIVACDQQAQAVTIKIELNINENQKLRPEDREQSPGAA